MTRLPIAILSTFLFLGLPTALAAPPVTELSQLMSPEDIQAMGLDSLSPQQQARLVQWITQQQSAGSPAPQEVDAGAVVTAAATTAAVGVAPTETQPETQASAAPVPPAEPEPAGVAAGATVAVAEPAANYENFGKPQPEQIPDAMRSRIVGEFSGWDGATLFRLENGQLWRQRYKTTWRTSMDNPEVLITRHMLGLHRMEVVGTGKTVAVKRVE